MHTCRSFAGKAGLRFFRFLHRRSTAENGRGRRLNFRAAKMLIFDLIPCLQEFPPIIVPNPNILIPHRMKRRIFPTPIGGGTMENGLWELFLETGEPMGYLLFKAEENSRETGWTELQPTESGSAPSASA